MSQKDVGNKVPIYKLKKTDEVMKPITDTNIAFLISFVCEAPMKIPSS